VVENGSILGGSSGTYEHGTTFNFTTTPAAEYVFNGWSGACSGLGTSCSVFMDSDKDVVANYVALHQVCDPLPPHATSASQTWNGTAYGVCEIANCTPGHALANN